MKHLYTQFWLAILFVGIIHAQEKSAITLKVELPKNAQKVSSSSAVISQRRKAKNSLITMKNDNQTFELNNVIFKYVTEKSTTGDDIPSLKEYSFKNSIALGVFSYFHFETRNINDYKVLITNYEFEDDDCGYFMCYAMDKSKVETFTLAVEYDKKDKPSVQATVTKFLNGIRFK